MDLKSLNKKVAACKLYLMYICGLGFIINMTNEWVIIYTFVFALIGLAAKASIVGYQALNSAARGRTPPPRTAPNHLEITK